jgi:hypothetical protein
VNSRPARSTPTIAPRWPRVNKPRPLHTAAATVAVPYPEVDQEAAGRQACRGVQLDVRNVTRDGAELSAEAVAA